MQITYCPETDDALLESLRSTAAEPEIEGLMVFATPGDTAVASNLEAVLTELSVPVFGGVFPELLYRDERKTSGAVVVGLEVTPDVTTVSGLSDPETDFGTQLAAFDIPRHATAFVFVDAYATQIDQFVDHLFRRYGEMRNFLGGGAGSLDLQQGPCLFTNDGILEDAAVVASVETPSTIGVRHGWTEIAGPFRVSDVEGRLLKALDGKPAFEVYQTAIEAETGRPVTTENFFDIAKSFPFGIDRQGPEQVVRDPYDVTDDGALRCFGQLPEGEFIHILEGDSTSLVEAAAGAYADALSRSHNLGAVFFFDCISRVLYLDEEFGDELSAVVDNEQQTTGALTIGEVATADGTLDFYNKTAVVGATGQL